MQSEPADPIDADRLQALLDGVEGWLHFDEAEALFSMVAGAPQDGRPISVVEIGSWKGRSTIAMAAALASLSGGGRVLAVDPHTGSVEHRAEYGAVDTFSEFCANIDRSGLGAFIEPVRRPSHEARPLVPDRSVDSLFIDGSHEYADVLQDIDDWVSSLRPGARVAYNDASWPGVYRALRERVVRRGTPYRNPRLVRSTLFVEYDPSSPFDGPQKLRWSILAATLAARRAANGFVPYLPERLKSWANSATALLAGR